MKIFGGFGARNRKPYRTRVVIADDDKATRFLLQTLLDDIPHIDLVGEARDGTEAVRLAIDRGADVVLLDVNMPGMDGFHAAEALAATRPDVRVILHTGDDDAGKHLQAEALGLRLIKKGSFDETLAVLSERAEFGGRVPA